MHNGNTWPLPFGEPAELELRTEWGSIALLPVEDGGSPRLELTRGSTENILVDIQKHGDVVRVALEPQRSFSWLGGGWECHVDLYVPRNVRAHMQTSAGSIVARDLEGCELGIKANAGKIDLNNVHGLLHLAADAGSISGRNVGGHLDIEAQAGSVRLDVSELRPGEHRIRATMGSVRLGLARRAGREHRDAHDAWLGAQSLPLQSVGGRAAVALDRDGRGAGRGGYARAPQGQDAFGVVELRELVVGVGQRHEYGVYVEQRAAGRGHPSGRQAGRSGARAHPQDGRVR